MSRKVPKVKPVVGEENAISSLIVRLQSVSLVALVFGLFIGSYFQRNLLEEFIFQPADGWCYKNQNVLGVHCFGDFGAPVNFTYHGLNGFYSSPVTSVYPPLNFYIFDFFRQLASIFDYRTSVMIYESLMLIGILVPIYYLFIKIAVSRMKALSITLGVLGFLPVIMTLDRGNIIGFSVPLLFYYLFSKTENRWKRILALCLLVGIKPHFIILVILNLKKSRWRTAIFEVGSVAATYFILFFIGAPSHSFKNIFIWISSLKSYANVDLGRQFPYNYSFAQGGYNWLNFLTGKSPSLHSCTILAIALGVISMFVLVAKSKRLSREILLILIIPLVFLIPSLSYAYYSIALLPIVFLEESPLMAKFPIEIGGKLLKIVYFASLLASIAPIYIGNDIFGIAKNSLNCMQIIVPSLWLLTYGIFVLSFLTYSFRSPKKFRG
jgi:hypothetical protein